MELTIDQALYQAVAAHKEGRLQEAEALYSAILQSQPNHSDANHNLGVLAFSSINAAAALPFLKIALEANPNVDQYWLSYIDALIHDQQISDALAMLKLAKQRGMQSPKLGAFEEKLRLLIGSDARKLKPQKKPLKLSERRKQQAARKKKKKHGKYTVPPQRQIDSLLRHYQSRDFASAEALAASITSDHPDHPIAWKVLGAVFASTGRQSSALAAHQRAATLAPDDPESRFNLAVTQQSLGKFQEAESSYNQAVALRPDYADAHCNLGTTLREQGKLAEAAASYEQAIALNPALALAYNNLGVTLRELGRLAESEAIGKQSIAIKPDYAEAHNNYGNTLKEQGRLIEAGESYKQAIAIKPNYADAHCNFGITLQILAKSAEAEQSFRRAIALNPGLAKAHTCLGLTLLSSGRFEEAEASYKQAISLNPDNAETYNSLGNTQRNCGKLLEAEASYKQALEIKSDYAMAYFNLGNTLRELGRLDTAIEAYRCAVDLDPTCPTFWISANFHFTSVPMNLEDIKREREDFLNALHRLRCLPSTGHQELLEFDTSMFYLAYHNFEDTKSVLEELQNTLREAPFSSPLIYQPRQEPLPNAARDVITLGICSPNLSHHTIGLLYRGLIGKLAAAGLEIILFAPSSTVQDDVEKAIKHLTSRTVNLNRNPHIAASQIEEANLDFLFYPDIGMSPFTYQLALSRLAPVQATSWGHPTTTGLATMDYFISSDLIEPEQAQAHYSEQLILLSRLPAVYANPAISSDIPSDRQSFALPENRLLIGVPQSLFKFHPDFDAILEQIMLALPDALLVLIQSKQDVVTKRLKARWERKAPQTLQRAVFLPMMSRENFIGLLGAIDLLLDPIYFGSGNTFYEAMAFGTPIVTMPGSRLSGRGVFGAYRQMQIENPPVANSVAEYVEWCVRLGSNKEALAALRAELRAAAERYLFDDTTAAEEFAHFIQAAVIASRNGSVLPADWQAGHR